MLVLWRRRRRSRVQAPDLGPELEAMLEAATEGRTEAWILARRCLLRRLGFDPEATPDLDRLEERLGARDLEPSMMALCKEVLAQADAARFAPEIAAVPNVERLEQLGALSFREVHR